MSSIRFDQISLVVRDVPASRAFYSRLGLDFGNAKDPVWEKHHVSSLANEQSALDVDLDSLSFAPKWNEGWSGSPGVVFGFKVESRQAVDDLVAELAADGLPVQQPPFDTFWGARYAVVSDPDGNGVGIMSPMDPDRRSQAPDPG
jgi:catechol 2,3-dioxygenase-like lactoylglutathione lyase family enzyme